MPPRTNRIASALLFAVIWAGGMLLWDRSFETSNIISILVAAALAGLLYYWLVDKFTRRAQAKK